MGRTLPNDAAAAAHRLPTPTIRLQNVPLALTLLQNQIPGHMTRPPGTAAVLVVAVMLLLPRIAAQAAGPALEPTVWQNTSGSGGAASGSSTSSVVVVAVAAGITLGKYCCCADGGAGDRTCIANFLSEEPGCHPRLSGPSNNLNLIATGVHQTINFLSLQPLFPALRSVSLPGCAGASVASPASIPQQLHRRTAGPLAARLRAQAP